MIEGGKGRLGAHGGSNAQTGRGSRSCRNSKMAPCLLFLLLMLNVSGIFYQLLVPPCWQAHGAFKLLI